MGWGTKVEVERRNRVMVAAYAYAYELQDAPLVSDEEFDRLCLKIRPKIETGSKKLDAFFRDEFKPHTGQWIHKHPHPNRLKKTIEKIRKCRGLEKEKPNAVSRSRTATH